VLYAALISSCKAAGLATSPGDDGKCASSACVPNPGKQYLTLTADHTNLKVGENVSITANFGGMLLNGTGNYLPATISDSAILSGSAFSAYGRSVGTASVTATYQGTSATLTFSVVPNDAGISAIVFVTVDAGGSANWFPYAARTHVGTTVQFGTTDNTNHKHNVIFDAVPGAPADITAPGSTVTRLFATAGSFTYSCTLHGETGVVNVIAP